MARKANDYLEFEWDGGNVDKNWIKHKVSNKETEQVFVDQHAFVTKNTKHSTCEPRYQILGVTFLSKYLAIFYTLRKKKIRIISARSMSKKERKQYEKQKEI